MAIMKTCLKCGKSKPTSEFSKRLASKDGLQSRCKKCNSVDNEKFRTEINPEHHAKWQKAHPQRLCELVSAYRKADKSSKIYAITNPKGEVYVGMTNMKFSVRMMEHRTRFRRIELGKEGTTMPMLHNSFIKYGMENHKFELLFESDRLSRPELKKLESKFIEIYKQKGKSLNIKL